MADDGLAPRSRRALLAAAAGGAAALAASAALPLSVAASDPNDVVKGVANATTATTSIDNSTSGSPSLATSAIGTGYGLQATSTGGAGVFAWSISEPPFWDAAFGAYTGVYGWSPESPDPSFAGTGVWGDSDDTGVYGSGGTGVYGYGGVGVVGESASTEAGVLALASSATDLALDVRGKVRFSRSGRVTVASGQNKAIISLGGVSSSSRVFAVLHSNRAGRWVASVVPTTGKFTIYLNGTVSSATYIAWFVIN